MAKKRKKKVNKVKRDAAKHLAAARAFNKKTKKKAMRKSVAKKAVRKYKSGGKKSKK